MTRRPGRSRRRRPAAAPPPEAAAPRTDAELGNSRWPIENRLLRVGAIAGACAAVLGIGAKVVDIVGGGSTTAPSATIDNVDVGDLVGIRAGFARTALGRQCPDVDVKHLTVSRPRQALHAGTLLADSGSTDVETSTQTGETTSTTSTTTSSTTATPTTTTLTTATGATRVLDTKMGVTPVQAGVSPKTRTVLRPDGIRVIDSVSPVVVTPGPGPSEPKEFKTEALTVAPEDYTHEQQKEVTAQAALIKTSTGTAEPVGRLIDLSVTLRGLKHRCVQLRWSLYEARTGIRAKELWLRDRPALRFVPGGQDESASQQFWVPVPRRGGRFFIRMGLFEPDGTRLTVARTEMFEEPGGDKNGFVT